MRYGLLPADIAVIGSALQAWPQVIKAIIFGSRAKGNYKPGSDVDIAIVGADIDQSLVAALSFSLNEETFLPYLFDIVHYDTIEEITLKEHIDRVGQVIFQREDGRW
jgi:predicted nucleotidyltransferase